MDRSTRFIAFAAAWLAGACASVEQAPREPAPTPAAKAAPATSPDAPPETDEPLDRADGAPAEIRAALERALDDGWQDLRILSECITEIGPESVEVFGNGVAVWGKKQQFSLTHDQIRQLLDAFLDADFAEMEDFYGGRDSSIPETAPDFRLPPPKGGASGRQPRRITCRVALFLDSVSKQAAQMRRGRQASALRQLAEHILDFCREPASTGVLAADLADALAKAAGGELAPETVEVMLHRKPGPNEEGEGFLLRIEDRRASSQAFRSGEGYAPPLALDLHPDDFRALMDLLARLDLGALPVNLWAEHYTDLTVQVLNQRKNVQARQFADMAPTEHGLNQERFERIFAELADVHRRVMAEGVSQSAE